jgi:hypothetical protein
MKKALATAVLAAAALTPVGAAEAEAGFKTARFVAYVEGKQTTTWNVPRYPTGGNCMGATFHESHGEEKIRWRTKPMKVLVFKAPRATSVQVRYGSWSIFSQRSEPGLTGTGTLVRSGSRLDTLDPGPCHDAGDPTSDDHGPYDCGTQPYDPSVAIGWRSNRVRVEVANMIKPLTDFVNCPVDGPLEPDEGEWTNISQRYPVKDVFDRSRGLIEVLGRKTWTEKIHRDHGTATTVTTFKLRLWRAR